MAEQAVKLLLIQGRDRNDLLRGLSSAPSDDSFATQLGQGSMRLALVSNASKWNEHLATAAKLVTNSEQPRLSARKKGIYFSEKPNAGKLALLFPGQGSQHPGMLRGWSQHFSSVRSWFSELDEAQLRAGSEPMWNRFTEDCDDRDRARLFDIGWGAQYGTFASLALHEILTKAGLRADAMVGHSNGEHAAVIAANRVRDSKTRDISDAFCRISIELRSLPAPRPDQTMLAVSAMKNQRIAPLLHKHAGSLFLAMDNCPNQQILSGSVDAIQDARTELLQHGTTCLALPFNRAYHTPMFQQAGEALLSFYESLNIQEATVPVYSCHSLRPLASKGVEARQMMAAQWVNQVRFQAVTRLLYENGYRSFLEVGPGNRLTAFVNDTLRGKEHLAVSCCTETAEDVPNFAQSLARLFTHGLDLDAERINKLFHTRTNQNPFNPSESWRFAVEVHQDLLATALQINQAIDRRMGVRSIRRDRSLSRQHDPLITEHSLGKKKKLGTGGAFALPVIPFTLSLQYAAEVYAELTGSRATEFRNARAMRWLALDHGRLDLEMKADQRGNRVQVSLAKKGEATAFETEIGNRSDTVSKIIAPGTALSPPKRWSPHDFYSRYAFHGPSYHGILNVEGIGPSGLVAELEVKPPANMPQESLQLNPALLDCSGQLVAFWLLDYEEREPTMGIFPFSLDRLVLHRPPPAVGTRVRCRAAITRDKEITEADFEFATQDGEALISLYGFKQRLVEFPAPLAQWLFSSESSPLSSDSRIRLEDWEILNDHQGIWARAIAHMALSKDERKQWIALPENLETRRVWLLERIALKEAVQQWGEVNYGQRQPLDEIEIGPDGRVSKSASLNPPELGIHRSETEILVAASNLESTPQRVS